MDLLAIEKSALIGMDKQKLRECEVEIRQRINFMRLDIFSHKGKHVGEKKKLRKSLARILTIASSDKKK